MTVDLVTRAAAPTLREQIQATKDLIAKDCTDVELDLFARVCERTGLDPFARQIYAIKRRPRDGSPPKLSIQTSIDGFRLIAERTGKYRGQLGPFWCGEDGVWKDVWLSSKPPAAARIGILHANFAEPVWSVARFADYNPGVGPMWSKMGPTMIAKCCESLGLRRCFPQELSGLYTGEEMDQAGTADYTPPVDSVPRSTSTGAPVGGNVPVPSSAGRGSWPKEKGEHKGEAEIREMDREYARVVNRNGFAPSDIEATLQKSVDANTVEVVDAKTGEVTHEAKATTAQLKKIRAMSNELNIPDSARKAGMLKYYKVNSSTLLTKAQAQDMIDRLEITKGKAAATMQSLAQHMGSMLEDIGDAPAAEEMHEREPGEEG